MAANLPISIDKTIPVPIYHQLQLAIKGLVLDGQLQPNDRLPSENELAHQFAISPMTVRQAMVGLVQDGWIYRKRGSGSFVAPRYMKHSLRKMASFTEDMKSRGLVPGSHILCFEAIPAQPYVAEALDLEPNAEVTHIKRLRLADDLAVGVHNTYLRDVDISCEELEVTESLYEVLQSKGIYLNEAEDMIEAVAATEEVADLLKMTPGSPILQVTRVARGLSGKPIELVIATYRNDLYRYIIRLKR